MPPAPAASRGGPPGAATCAHAAVEPPDRPRARIRGRGRRRPLTIARSGPRCAWGSLRPTRQRDAQRTIATIPARISRIQPPGSIRLWAQATATAASVATNIERQGRTIGLRPRCDLKKTKRVGSRKAPDHRQRGAVDAELGDQHQAEPDEGEHRDDRADDERNALVGVLDRLVDHPVDGRRDEAAGDERDQRRGARVGGRRDPDHHRRHHGGHQHRPREHEPEVAELGAAGVADPVLLLDGPEHRRLLQRPQRLAVAAGQDRDEEGRLARPGGRCRGRRGRRTARG